MSSGPFLLSAIHSAFHSFPAAQRKPELRLIKLFNLVLILPPDLIDPIPCVIIISHSLHPPVAVLKGNPNPSPNPKLPINQNQAQQEKPNSSLPPFQEQQPANPNPTLESKAIKKNEQRDLSGFRARELGFIP